MSHVRPAGRAEAAVPAVPAVPPAPTAGASGSRSRRARFTSAGAPAGALPAAPHATQRAAGSHKRLHIATKQALRELASTFAARLANRRAAEHEVVHPVVDSEALAPSVDGDAALGALGEDVARFGGLHACTLD